MLITEDVSDEVTNERVEDIREWSPRVSGHNPASAFLLVGLGPVFIMVLLRVFGLQTSYFLVSHDLSLLSGPGAHWSGALNLYSSHDPLHWIFIVLWTEHIFIPQTRGTCMFLLPGMSLLQHHCWWTPSYPFHILVNRPESFPKQGK